VRSGQLVSFDGNLVIIGDVNPAVRFVQPDMSLLWDRFAAWFMQGQRKQGSFGSCSEFATDQLRIADVITRPPDEKETVGHFSPNWHMSRMHGIYRKIFACKMSKDNLEACIIYFICKNEELTNQ